MGFYCDRCGASIWMSTRQEKYRTPRGEKAGDPYVSVNRVAFFDDKGVVHNDAFTYCFDCEPVVIETLTALNKAKPCEKTKTETTAPEPSASTETSALPLVEKKTRQ